MEGYVKFHRKMTEWGWYKDVNTCHLFMHLIFSANWKDGEFMGIKVKRGQLVTGINAIARQTGLTSQNVRTALKHLESTGEISRKTTNKFSVITVENYEKYQCVDNDANNQLTSNQQSANNQLTNNQQQEKEGKKERKKECKNNKPPKPPLVDVVADAPAEIQEDLWAFVDHRKALKAPMTGEAMKRMLTKLNKLSGGDIGIIKAILSQSMEQGWKGVFELQASQPRGKPVDFLDPNL